MNRVEQKPENSVSDVSGTDKLPAERRLEEQRELNSIITDTVHRILDSRFSLHDIAQAVLDSAIAVTAGSSGILLFDGEKGPWVVERHCTRDCSSCLFPDLLERIDADESLMARRAQGHIPGSYYLNERIDTGGECQGKTSLQNMLRVPVRQNDTVQGHIVLFDSVRSYTSSDLENMEKISDVLSLALVRQTENEDLKKAKEKAEREASVRSRFLARVSHEIRSPLNGVLLMSSMLDDSELTAEQKELVSVVMFSARTIDRLIRDLTDLTQISTGKLEIINEDFNLEELCRTIIETNRPAALLKGLRLEQTIEREVIRYFGDRERIGQIIGNLVSNAIKYTDRGRVKLDVSISDSTLSIVVSDTGIGISGKLQDEVFSLFKQGNQFGRKKCEGVGIGLSLVRELSELMGGRVSVKSEPEQGSIFTVKLPVSHQTSSYPSSPAVGSTMFTGESALPEKARVLVVEDEGVDRLYLRTLLEQDGWLIDEAVNGIEAVALTSNNRYDLVLMDMSMPGMGGLEAGTLIRAKNPFLPIIAITANAYAEDRSRILEAGLNDIVLKPVDENVLRRSLKRCLKRLP